MYASWYRQTYPDKVLAISQTSNEGLVSVDNSGTVRLWETGVANLAQSMTEWKVGSIKVVLKVLRSSDAGTEGGGALNISLSFAQF